MTKDEAEGLSVLELVLCTASDEGSMSKTVWEVDERELCSLLAGLRMLQTKDVSNEISAIATNNGEDFALDMEQIDDLYNRLALATDIHIICEET